MLCTEQAALSIAEGDAQSQSEASSRHHHFIQAGECKIFPGWFPTEVFSVALEYKDYEGEPVQVIEVHESGKPGGRHFYVIIVKKIAAQIPRKQGFGI